MRILNTGVGAALIGSFLLVLSQLVSRFFVAELDYNVWAFVCLQGLAGGIMLLLYAGKNGLVNSSLKHPISWIMGVFIFLDTLFFTFALVYISATEANVLVGYAKILCLICAYIMFKRPIGWSRIPGIIILLSSMVYITLTLDGGFLNTGFIFVVLTCCCLTVEVMLTEYHPSIVKAKTIKERCGYTGALLSITSLIFLLFMVLASLFKEYIAPDTSTTSAIYNNIPHIKEVLNVKFILLSILVGIVLRASMMFFRYFALIKMKPENYLMIASVQSFILFAAENIGVKFGVYNSVRLDITLLIPITLSIIGALLCVRNVKN